MPLPPWIVASTCSDMRASYIPLYLSIYPSTASLVSSAPTTCCSLYWNAPRSPPTRLDCASAPMNATGTILLPPPLNSQVPRPQDPRTQAANADGSSRTFQLERSECEGRCSCSHTRVSCLLACSLVPLSLAATPSSARSHAHHHT